MTNQELYAYFVNKYAALVYQHGKRRIGWEEIFTIGGTPAQPLVASGRGLMASENHAGFDVGLKTS